MSFVFSFGVRVPYSRPVNAVLDFLRDVTNPYLRIFRRLRAAVRPDRPSARSSRSWCCQIVGRLIVNLIDPMSP